MGIKVTWDNESITGSTFMARRT
uniref:Uncharacterized protein n=1 Tax=Tetranychus urticae TaxID=32264 RepID=T1KW31_TETUR